MNKLRLLPYVAILALALPAAADEDPAESRSAAFQAMDGARGEQVPGGPLLVTAYGTVMVLLVGCVARLGLMQRKTTADVARLSAALKRNRGAGQ